MPNFPTHITSGALVSFIIALTFLKTGFGNTTILIVGFILGLIASAFPDIDQENSIPRNVLRTYFPALVAIAFIYLFFKMNMMQREILEILGFLCVPAIIILSYEKFIPRHRGAIHKLPGLLTMLFTIVPVGILLNAGINTFMILGIFTFCGFSTHILLDNIL